jgi:hypothetical protein
MVRSNANVVLRDASVCRSEEATCGDVSREIDDCTTP